MNPFKAIINLFLPNRCIICGERLSVSSEYICCLPCTVDFPKTKFWAEDNKMTSAFRELTGDNRCFATSLFYYKEDSPFRAITHSLKYEYGLKTGRYYSELLAQEILHDWVFQDLDLIIPVPIHAFRRFTRGYNQSEVIAKTLGSELEVKTDNRVIKRSRYTKTQTKLSGSDKQSNVSGAFKALKKVDAKHILLVDDVYTSGSTLAECYKVLRECTDTDTKISIATLAFVDKL